MLEHVCRSSPGHALSELDRPLGDRYGSKTKQPTQRIATWDYWLVGGVYLPWSEKELKTLFIIMSCSLG